MNLTLQELHTRLSNYLENVEKATTVLTNHDFGVAYFDNKGQKQEDIYLKIGALIYPLDQFMHKALFFNKFGSNEISILHTVLEEFEKVQFSPLKIQVHNHDEGNRIIKDENFVFTGKVFIETNDLTIEREEAYSLIRKLDIKYKGKPLSFGIRDNISWEQMDRKNWTSVFLCHDSRDKEYVEKIHFELTKKHIITWYDKYSLKLGDSLVEKISEGLNESDYAIIFLSKSFLANERWVKFELQSLMNKQIYQEDKVIIPVWVDIDEEDLKVLHWLRDKVAVKAEEGMEQVIFKLTEAIR